MKGVNVGSPEYKSLLTSMPALQFATVDQELYNWAVTSFNKISIIECTCIKFYHTRFIHVLHMPCMTT